MNITKNNQVEDLKTYSVARTINWRETFEVEVQAKNEEEATEKAKEDLIEQIDSRGVESIVAERLYGHAPEEIFDMSNKAYIVSVDLPDSLYLKVVAQTDVEAEQLVERHGVDDYVDPSEFYIQERPHLVVDDEELSEFDMTIKGVVGQSNYSEYTSGIEGVA